jgi:hypothetical protein
MDINTNLMAQFSEDFVRERRNSWATYRYGTGSPTVAIIRRLAAAIRRSSAAIESWANGPNEAPRNFRQPNVPAR